LEALTFKSFQISRKRKYGYILAFSSRTMGFLAARFGISVKTATFCQWWMSDRHNKAMTKNKQTNKKILV